MKACLQGERPTSPMEGPMRSARPLFIVVFIAVMLAAAGPAQAVLPFRFGLFPSGPLDGITDVPGVRVGNLTKVEGSDIRTGATAVLPNADPWDKKVAAGF